MTTTTAGPAGPATHRIGGDMDFDELYPGRTLETYGADLEESRRAPERCVWTIVDGDEGDNLYALAGWHYVNRVLYYVSHRPWQSPDEEYLWHEGGNDE